jgi:hypothetical protein
LSRSNVPHISQDSFERWRGCPATAGELGFVEACNSPENVMALLTVMYKKPHDADAFDKHYFEKHIPLAKKIPA